jgi:hypothetical protein
LACTSAHASVPDSGEDAAKVAGNHWVVRGDRGITYADAMPEGTKVVAGAWWPEGYDGPPQISFAAEEAEEMGLKLGDKITVNVLGRDIEAEITSFREVDFSSGGMGFVLTLNAASVAGAPHSHIATVYAKADAEAARVADAKRVAEAKDLEEAKKADARKLEETKTKTTATATKKTKVKLRTTRVLRYWEISTREYGAKNSMIEKSNRGT